MLATVGGLTGFAATSANASTTDAQLCKDMDVRATATKAQDSPSGHHAVVLHYTAAEANTHCTLSGAPYGATFYDGSNTPLGVTSRVANGSEPDVTIDGNHSARSYVLIPNTSEPGPASVAGLRFHLPSDASSVPVGVAWPDSALTGSPQFTNIIQN